MGSFLVVANKTLGGEALAARLRGMIEADPGSHFVVIVPVSAPMPVDPGGAMGVMSGITVLDYGEQDQLREIAQERLATLLRWFREAGVSAEGTVVGDPMSAMTAAVDAHDFDEIVISTLPARVSQWLRLDLVRRAARRFDVPIVTVTATDDSLPPAFDQGSPIAGDVPRKEAEMTDSVYKIVELVGTSTESWEKAAAAAVTQASQTLRDLRVAEVSELDLVVGADGSVSAYRAKIKVSFKYGGEE